MKNKKLETILSDENLVNKILESETSDELKDELGKKGLILEEKDLGQFSGILADAFEEMENKRFLHEPASDKFL